MAKDKPKPQEGAGGKLSLLPLCTDLEDPCSLAWNRGLSRMEQRNLALKALSPKDQFELLVALSAGLSHWRCAQLVKCSPRTVTMFVEYCNETMAGGLLAQGVSLQESAAVASACDFFELLIPHIFELGPRSSTTGVSYILAQELHTMAKTPPAASQNATHDTGQGVTHNASQGTCQDTSQGSPQGASQPNLDLPQSCKLIKRTKLGDQQLSEHTDHMPIMPQLDTSGTGCDTIVRVTSHDTQPFITNRIQLSYDRLEGTRIQWNTAPEPADNGPCAASLGFRTTTKPGAAAPSCIQERGARPHGDAISDQKSSACVPEFEAITPKLIRAPVGLEGIVHWAVEVTDSTGPDGASCTGNTAPAPEPCTSRQAPEPFACTGNQVPALYPCTPSPAGMLSPCTEFQVPEWDPCTGKPQPELETCTDFEVVRPNPCTGIEPPSFNPCTEFELSWPNPCTGFEPPCSNPCTEFEPPWPKPCTDFAPPWPNPCTEFQEGALRSCTNFCALELDFTSNRTVMGGASLGLKTDLDHAMSKICIQDTWTGRIDCVRYLEGSLTPASLVSDCLVKPLLNNKMPCAPSAAISVAGSEERRLSDLQRLLWDYWLRHHNQITRYLQQLQEGGVQGLLMVPSDFKRQASLAAYHEHAQRCQAQDDLNATLGSTAQAFAHLSPALQQGVVWELLLSQWYEGVVRYLGPGLFMRICQVRSLRRVRGDSMAELTQALNQRGPALSVTPVAPQDCYEAENGLKAPGRKPSYRGFMAHHQPRPLLDDLRWERSSHKLNSALKQFMRDPSCRRYRAGLNAS